MHQTYIFILFLLLLSANYTFLISQTGTVQYKPYGFIRFNATYDFQDLDRSDLFKPSMIVIPEENQRAGNMFLGVRQSRIGIELSKLTKIGSFKGVFEIDFHDTSTGIVGKARIRHIYAQWKGLTVGHTWSTFYDIQARPNIVDFEGANSSTLHRAPLIRLQWTFNNHNLSWSLEHPIEQITVRGNATIAEPNLPVLASAYKVTFRQGNDFIKFAALVRQLRFSIDNRAKGVMGWGSMIMGRIRVLKRDIVKFQLITGKGIARYIEGVRGLGYDGIFNEDTNDLETLGINGGFFSYQHFWNKQWNSSFVIGTTQIEQSKLLTSDDLKSGDYASVNLFYHPIPSLALGLESLFGRRVNVNGASARGERLQFSATFSF